MTYLLKNEQLEIQIDPPGANYQLARFDWTGKIVSVKYQGRYVTGAELAESSADTPCGRGFYNEFGIDGPLGYAETVPGDWFHKIGVGLLRKDEATYNFHKAYAIEPADFTVHREPEALTISCHAREHNGYAYLLRKEIRLLTSGFSVLYQLTNTGQQPIETSEYNHNFLAINQDPIGSHYRLRFPFMIQPERFGETVNPEALVRFTSQEVHFSGQPTQAFFFSQLAGGELVDAHWALENRISKIGIAETGNFPTTKVNLWGGGHVISPELFINLSVAPGQTQSWTRTYRMYELP